MVAFGIAFRIREHFMNSIWYIAFIVFILFMTYIGSDGALNVIPFFESTIIVTAVSVLIFFPWGILSGLKTPYRIEERAMELLE